MEVGNYVRYKKPYAKEINLIAKVIEIIEPDKDVKSIVYYTDTKDMINDKYIKKSSPNIIDLIEENDLIEIEYYSNRYKERVSRIFEVDFINKNRDVCFENGHCRLNMFYGEWSNQDKLLNPIIKSIITHEQIESMEYKVKE